MELAKVALHAPDRDQDLTVYTIALFEAGQQFGILLEQFLAVSHSQRRQRSLQVFPHRAGEFGLAAVCLDHIHVRRHANERAVEGVCRDTGLQRLLAEAGLPLGKCLQRLNFSTHVGLGAGQSHYRRGLGGGQRQGIGGGGLFRAGDEQD
ncbi:hypothetical protein D3C81_1318030 [compost metagenome]